MKRRSKLTPSEYFRARSRFGLGGQRNRAGHASRRQRDPIYKTAILEVVPATPLNIRSRRHYFGGVPAFRSWATAVTSFASPNGFFKKMLLGTPHKTKFLSVLPG